MPAHVHAQPNPATFMSTAGTPDHYFDYHSDLWVEWKVFGSPTKLPPTVDATKLLSGPQTRWLNRRWSNGRNAVVIAGIKIRARAYGLVLADPVDWSRPISREEYEPMLRPSADLAAYITDRVTKRNP